MNTNTMNLGASPMNSKKVWTAPAVTVITLHAAKGGANPGVDGGSRS
jgi:hypothetical protein